MEKFSCPVCKHTGVLYERDPEIISGKRFYLSVCENCNCVYCYKILLMNMEGISLEEIEV